MKAAIDTEIVMRFPRRSVDISATGFCDPSLLELSPMSFCINADLSPYILHRRLPCMFLTLTIPFFA
jgi:hypothetical protein